MNLISWKDQPMLIKFGLYHRLVSSGPDYQVQPDSVFCLVTFDIDDWVDNWRI